MTCWGGQKGRNDRKIRGRRVCKEVAEMKTRIVDGVEVHRGSGNVFPELGLPDAEKLKIKTGLVIEIK